MSKSKHEVRAEKAEADVRDLKSHLDRLIGKLREIDANSAAISAATEKLKKENAKLRKGLAFYSKLSKKSKRINFHLIKTLAAVYDEDSVLQLEEALRKETNAALAGKAQTSWSVADSQEIKS